MRSIGPEAVRPGSVFLYLVNGAGGVGLAATLTAVPPQAAINAAATSRTGRDTLVIRGIPPRFLCRAHGSADVWRLRPAGARVIGRSTGTGTGLRYRFSVAMLLRDSLWWRPVSPAVKKRLQPL